MKPKPIICSLLALLLCFQYAAASELRFSPRPNKASLIEWRSWSGETLSEAKRQNRPILLSLSAVWCHWCHVMDETTYSDDDIISFINSNFIPVRVDADMRPDIDSLYNQGGWPSTVILTPSGDIIDGGTYLRPEEMMTMMSKWIQLFSREPQLLQSGTTGPWKTGRTDTDEERGHFGVYDIVKITGMMKSFYDERYGGFGFSQKFPNPDAIDFLLSGYVMEKDALLGEMITTTLNSMMEGDIYDHVEGGFFRYATRPDWSSPHFEKMLIDNAGIIRNYAEMYAVTGNEQYRKVVSNTIRYVETYLSEKDTGRFYGSQDADEKYYSKPDRKEQPAPYVDTTTYADAQSLMISALTSAYSATGKVEYLRLAEKGMAFVLDNLYEEGAGVYHYFSEGKKHRKGLLLDNVFFGSALLDLYNVTGDRRYLSLAENTADLITLSFHDRERGHFITVRDADLRQPERPGALHEYQFARVQYRAALFLGRIFAVNRDEKVRTAAGDVLSAFRGKYDRYPPSSPLYGKALRWFIEDPVSFVIVARRVRSKEFLAEINKIFLPEKSVLILSPDEDMDMIRQRGYPAEEEALYICKGKRCSRPIKKPGDLREVLEGFLVSGGSG